jgi:ring-1,2-phenylacetyl-CoA epoxidase subunit PaaA
MHHVVIESPEALNDYPPQLLQDLLHMVLAHTEGELSGADTYKAMLPFAPNAQELKILYEAAADEIGHYMLGAQVLAGLGVDASYMLRTQPEARYHYPSEFVADPANWAERGLTSMLAESAALAHLIEMRECSYRPLAAICDQTISEESAHIAHGKRIVAELCDTNEGRAACQKVLESKWPQCLDLFGRSTSERSKRFLQWGLRQLPNDVARQEWARKTREKLAGLDLVAPSDHLNRQFL